MALLIQTTGVRREWKIGDVVPPYLFRDKLVSFKADGPELEMLLNAMEASVEVVRINPAKVEPDNVREVEIGQVWADNYIPGRVVMVTAVRNGKALLSPRHDSRPGTKGSKVRFDRLVKCFTLLEARP